VAAAASPATRPATPPAAPVYPQPGSNAEPLKPAPPPRRPPEDEELGVDCRLCGTRMYVRRKQIGTTVKCPDCHSPVVVKVSPKRKASTPDEFDEADLYKMSEPVELPSATYVPPTARAEGAAPGPSPAAGTSAGAGRPNTGGTAMQQAARALLEKMRKTQEEEEAEERERSPERFTQGLFDFFADRHALIRLCILAVWFEVAATMFRWATGMTVSENASAILAEATSWVAAVALGVAGLTFLVAAAACGLALVQDSSDGLRKIENWPGANFLQWPRDVRYIISAGFLAALPGAAIGILLGLAGITGTVLFTAAGSFVGLFPPMLLSMFDSSSALAPFSKETWGSIRERPDPWKLTYLITSIFAIGGLFGLVVSLISGFFVGVVGAVAMVACMMVYFRTVGWLMRFLAGRDEKP
jgi:DNA-directed RNA polymerase subunit RPC12/RpoP